ncbi:MAG: magnesium transporter CorA family protein [Nanoarchaeota archaeon]|nr:magnesium transporter CorA family protein [Nanoarchaeota archaeon]MBU4452533.1 magnesium transporter CorA family protein [Nanoarchaeota archaeon]MCG2723238.1 magnesium transporter CorA family protein [archaeon]
MISVFKKTIRDKELQQIDEPKVGSWISLVDPTEEEINKIVDELELDRKNLTDALDEYELPRIEKEEGVMYVLIKTPIEEQDAIYTIPIGIVVTKDYIITITKKTNSVIESVLSKNKNICTTQKINFMIHLFLLVSDKYDQYLKKISKDIKRRKTKMADLSNEDIINIIKQEEVLNDFISSFLPTVNIFEKLLGGKYIPLYQNDKDIIEDVLINSRQTLDLCRSNIKTATNIREAYSTVLSNNLNKTIKLLTVFTIILAIPTTIASLFGMNVLLPMKDNPHMFLYILSFVFGITLLLVYIFFRKKWI